MLGRTWTMRNELRRLHEAGALRVPKQLRHLTVDDLEQAVYSGHATVYEDTIVPDITGGSRQFWCETLFWATTTGTAVAGTASETIVYPDVTIPGNYMQDGRGLAIRVSGEYSTLGSGTVTLRFRLRWGGVGGTLLIDSGTVTVLISASHWLWVCDIELQTQVNGSSGKLEGFGYCHVFGGTSPTIGSATGSPAEAPMTAGGQTTPAQATVDLTADTAMSFTVQHGASSASNTLTGRQYTIKSLN